VTSHPRPLQAPRLTDGAVTIRERRESDIPAIVAACQDPEIPRYTRVPDNYTEAEALAFFSVADRRQDAGESLDLLVVEAPDGPVLGSIGLHVVPGDPHRAQVGYWVAAPARQRGVATRALGLLSRWAIPELELARLELRTLPENVMSQRVAEGAGFTREGLLRAFDDHKGRRVDLVMFSLLPGDVEAAG
jgi:RimJ/RimL family protein N-acetyltransferase